MGIIAKQGLRSTLFIYLGILIGFVSTIFLTPQLLSAEEIGFLSYISSVTGIFVAFFSFGIVQMIARMYPRYRALSFKDQKGFFSFIFNLTIVGIVFGLVLFFLFDFRFETHSQLNDYQSLFALLFPILLFFRMLQRHSDPLINMMYNSVLGTFLDNFLVKVLIFISLTSFWILDYSNFTVYALLYILAFCVPGLIEFSYVLSKQHFALKMSEASSFFKTNKKEIISLMSFGTLGSAGAIFVFEIDKIMIGNMLDLSFTGIYSIAFFFSLFIAVPGKSIRKIAVILISEAWSSNDLESIQSIYKKSSLNLFLIGVFLFLGLWLNIDQILSFLPPEFEKGKYVILFLGLAQLLDLLTGVNIEIISTSKDYRFSTYFIVVMIVLVTVSNYLFIPIWGINGAAIASLCSITIINLARTILLYIKYKIHPFSIRLLTIFITGGACFVLLNLITITFEPWLTILLKGSLLTIIYFPIIVWAKVSPDLNGLINKTFGTHV